MRSQRNIFIKSPGNDLDEDLLSPKNLSPNGKEKQVREAKNAKLFDELMIHAV
jgi:hypothetical protein